LINLDGLHVVLHLKTHLNTHFIQHSKHTPCRLEEPIS
jgi:hypothetical protein